MFKKVTKQESTHNLPLFDMLVEKEKEASETGERLRRASSAATARFSLPQRCVLRMKRSLRVALFQYIRLHLFLVRFEVERSKKFYQ